jgi:hypothetical protein
MKKLTAFVLVIMTAGCATQPSQHPAPPAPQPPVKAAAASYYLIPGTASPHGAYTLAWGIKGNSHVNWKRLETGDDAYLDSLLGEQGQNVRDYIVNQHAKQIVGTLQGVRYFKIGNRSENHGSLAAAWTSDERLALVVHGGKWTFRSFDAVTLRHGQILRQSDIGKTLTTSIRLWPGQHYPAQYTAAKSKLVIDVENPVFKSNNADFTADVIAQIPKADTDFSFEGKGTFHLQRQGNGSVSVSLVSLVAN